MLSIAALIIFPVLMAYAAASDMLTMRIANGLVIAVAIAYFALAFIAQRPLAEIGMSAAVGAGVLAITFTFFAFGWIGGGDAKLAAATALWMGLSLQLAQYALYSALLGGGLTLLILAFRHYPLLPFMLGVKWIERLHDAKTGIPYGIALAIAAILVYPETPIFAHFVGL